MTEQVTWYKYSISDDNHSILESYEPTFQRDLKHYIVRYNDALWMPNEFMTIMLGRFGYEYCGTRVLTFGRRKFYKITDEAIDAMTEHNAHERRNKREKAIQARNDRIIDQLIELL